MKRVTSAFHCKQCAATVEFSFEKPNRIDSRRVHTFCKQCDLDYDMTVKFERGTNGKGLDIVLKYKLPAPKESAEAV